MKTSPFKPILSQKLAAAQKAPAQKAGAAAPVIEISLSFILVSGLILTATTSYFVSSGLFHRSLTLAQTDSDQTPDLKSASLNEAFSKILAENEKRAPPPQPEEISRAPTSIAPNNPNKDLTKELSRYDQLLGQGAEKDLSTIRHILEGLSIEYDADERLHLIQIAARLPGTQAEVKALVRSELKDPVLLEDAGIENSEMNPQARLLLGAYATYLKTPTNLDDEIKFSSEMIQTCQSPQIRQILLSAFIPRHPEAVGQLKDDLAQHGISFGDE